MVVSGKLDTVCRDAEAPRALLEGELANMAAALHRQGAVIGHVKSSCSVAQVDFLSVTDEVVSSRRAPLQDLQVRLTAIVFSISASDAEALVRGVLERIGTQAESQSI